MLSLHDLRFTFPGNLVRALDGVNLDFTMGSIQAVIGENGAGKSTLARICTGHLRTTGDSLNLDSELLQLQGPADALARGLALVPQHPRLAPELPVWQNLLLGAPCDNEKQTTLLFKRQSLAMLRQKLAGWDIDLPLETSARQLDASHVHWTVIAEALLANPRYLFLDEPSAPYAPGEITRLYGLLRRCTAKGMCVVVITHHLQEVLDHADHIHILRRGHVVTSLAAQTNLTKADLLGPMFGESIPGMPTLPKRQIRATSKAVSPGTGLIISRLTARNGPGRNLDSLDFSAPAGRITGIIGLKDQGLEILEDILAGQVKAVSGHIRFEGIDLQWLKPLHRGYIPGRRFQRGIAPGRSIGDNAIARARETLFPRGILSRLRLSAWFAKGDQELFQNPEAPIITLSGGMIQRLIFQRELELPLPRVVIAAEPFYGLDRHFQLILQERLTSLAEQGAVVVFMSSDLDDAIESCDSLLVLRGGRLVFRAEGPDYDRSDIAMKLVQSDSSRESKA